ncbi:MAG TPA: SGNH/GDSL hydrolase family protein [Gaiellaceae bacterium]|jgi:lysophospholipase L1-like esterase
MRVATALALAALLLPACGSGDESAGGIAPTSTASEQALRLVAVGDSIPTNDPLVCRGCTGFVDRYAAAVEKATGEPVQVENLTQPGSTLPELVAGLDGLRAPLENADVILVGIAHNSNELASDRPCGKPRIGESPDWAAMTERCAKRSAADARPLYDRVFSGIAGLRRGKPTILRTINRYNDWNGLVNAHLTPAQERATAVFVREWNAVLCASAKANGFGCADISKAFNGPAGLKRSGPLLAPDYTHPSDAGNAVIARTLAALGFAPLS